MKAPSWIPLPHRNAIARHVPIGLVVVLMGCLVMPASVQAQVEGPGATEKVVDVYITVMTMAYPPAGGALAAARGLMGALGFFDKPDMIAAAIQLINQRLDALENRVTLLEERVQQLENRQLRNENLARIRLLRSIQGRLEGVIVRLQQRPAARDTRIALAHDARVIAEEFLVDRDLWNWSDQALKDHRWEGREVKAGTMLEADFKPMPALEYYVAALTTWMIAVEFAADGDRAWVEQAHGSQLQRHIDFNRSRYGWNELRDDPVTLPEHIRKRVIGLYEPSTRYPRNRVCVINEFLKDRMARQIDYVGSIDVPVLTDNEFCNVPAGFANTVTSAEDELERAYGTELMTLLVQKLTQLKDHATVRGSYVDILIPPGPIEPRFPAFIYAVTEDGTLKWFRHNGARTGSGLETPGAWEGPRDVGDGWANHQVFAGGGDLIYAVASDGTLKWAAHHRFNDGAGLGTPDAWEGPRMVGDGWNRYRQVFSAGEDAIYAITPEGTLLWYGHRGARTGAGLESPGAWVGPKEVGDGWQRAQQVFASSGGIIYAVMPDGKLLWSRHNGYQTGAGLETPGAWEGPKEVGDGWNKFRQVFSPGDGIIYAVNPDGKLLWYKHNGYQTGAGLETPGAWEGPKEVGDGWNKATQVFALLPKPAGLTR